MVSAPRNELIEKPVFPPDPANCPAGVGRSAYSPLPQIPSGQGKTVFAGNEIQLQADSMT